MVHALLAVLTDGVLFEERHLKVELVDENNELLLLADGTGYLLSHLLALIRTAKPIIEFCCFIVTHGLAR